MWKQPDYWKKGLEFTNELRRWRRGEGLSAVTIIFKTNPPSRLTVDLFLDRANEKLPKRSEKENGMGIDGSSENRRL